MNLAGDFELLLSGTCKNSFTMSPTRGISEFNAIGIIIEKESRKFEKTIYIFFYIIQNKSLISLLHLMKEILICHTVCGLLIIICRWIVI